MLCLVRGFDQSSKGIQVVGNTVDLTFNYLSACEWRMRLNLVFAHSPCPKSGVNSLITHDGAKDQMA